MMWQIGESRERHTPPNAVQKAKAKLEDLNLSTEDKAILHYVLQLTIHPANMNSQHVEQLRLIGFKDSEIHDIVMVISCFAFMNSLADGTGVRIVGKRRQFAIELLGEECWKQHEIWAKGQ